MLQRCINPCFKRSLAMSSRVPRRPRKPGPHALLCQPAAGGGQSRHQSLLPTWRNKRSAALPGGSSGTAVSQAGILHPCPVGMPASLHLSLRQPPHTALQVQRPCTPQHLRSCSRHAHACWCRGDADRLEWPGPLQSDLFVPPPLYHGAWHIASYIRGSAGCCTQQATGPQRRSTCRQCCALHGSQEDLTPIAAWMTQHALGPP